MQLRVKRVYEFAEPGDGARVLVDHSWPRGLPKRTYADIVWLKELAPGTALRRWFSYDPARYAEFGRRYVAELERKKESVGLLMEMLGEGPVTLLHAVDTRYNHARALADYLREAFGQAEPTGEGLRQPTHRHIRVI